MTQHINLRKHLGPKLNLTTILSPYINIKQRMLTKNITSLQMIGLMIVMWVFNDTVSAFKDKQALGISISHIF